MAGIVTSNKTRKLVGNRLKEIDVPTTTLNTALYYADLTAQAAAFTAARVNAELNAYPTVVKNNASLVLTPSANKAGVVYAMNGDSKTLEEFEFQRGSSGTYFNASGVMQLAAPNVPRINFENGVAKGLLIEPSSANLITDSGLETAVGVIDLTWNIGSLLNKGIRHIWIDAQVSITSKSYVVTSGKTYVFSVFVKLDDGSMPIATGSLASRDVSLVVFGGAKEANVSPVGGGVYRVWGAYTATYDGVASFGIGKYYQSTNKPYTFSGMQLEEGNVPTSYIPTTTAIATRLADKVLSKRPTVVFPKNSIFVKTAEYPSVWFGNGVSDINIAGRNLITISNDGLWHFISFSDSILTKTNNKVSVPEWGIANANRVVTSGGSNTLKTILLFNGTPKIGEVVAISGWFKNNHPTDNLIIDPSRSGMSATLAPNEQRRVVFDNIPGTGAASVRIRAFSPTVGGYVDFTWSRLQYENGSAATAWSPAPEDYVKTDVNGNIEFVYNEPIHIQQFSLISRELSQEEV